ncbi:uncharacterized protein [Ptychodera flava]
MYRNEKVTDQAPQPGPSHTTRPKEASHENHESGINQMIAKYHGEANRVTEKHSSRVSERHPGMDPVTHWTGYSSVHPSDRDQSGEGRWAHVVVKTEPQDAEEYQPDDALESEGCDSDTDDEQIIHDDSGRHQGMEAEERVQEAGTLILHCFDGETAESCDDNATDTADEEDTYADDINNSTTTSSDFNSEHWGNFQEYNTEQITERDSAGKATNSVNIGRDGVSNKTGPVSRSDNIALGQVHVSVPDNTKQVSQSGNIHVTQVRKSDNMGLVHVSKSDNVGQVPKSDNVGQVPKSDHVGKVPKSDNIAQVPKSDNIAQVPKSDNVGQVPKSDIVGQVPKSDHVGQVPKSGNVGQVILLKSDNLAQVSKSDGKGQINKSDNIGQVILLKSDNLVQVSKSGNTGQGTQSGNMGQIILIKPNNTGQVQMSGNIGQDKKSDNIGQMHVRQSDNIGQVVKPDSMGHLPVIVIKPDNIGQANKSDDVGQVSKPGSKQNVIVIKPNYIGQVGKSGSTGHFNKFVNLVQVNQSARKANPPMVSKRKPPLVCSKCGYVASHKLTLMRHKAKHYPTRFKCHLCEYATHIEYLLENHIRRCHTAHSDKLFICAWKDCNRRFAMEVDLKVHSRVHEQDSMCHICGKKGSINFLVGHLAREHGVRKGSEDKETVKCKLCGKEYSSKSQMSFKQHMMKHNNEKPFKCRFCSKGFVSTNFLLAHERIHTGEKPYKCQICKLAFAKDAQLISHVRTHTGEKPYKCKQCSYASTWNIQLRQHVKAHGAATEVSCMTCDISFISEKALKIHYRKHHTS